MHSIFKKAGVILGAIVAMMSTGCNKQNQTDATPNETQVSDKTSEKANQDSAKANQDSATDSNQDAHPGDELPSNHDDEVKPIYGMPDMLDAQQPVAEPEELPKVDENSGIMALYGMPMDDLNEGETK